MIVSTDLRSRPSHAIFRSELIEAASNHGYRRERGEADGWLYFSSEEGVPGEVALASGKGEDGAPWFLAVEHPGVATSLAIEIPGAAAGPPPGTCRAVFVFAAQEAMRHALSRAFHLARSLPDFPLSLFEAEVDEALTLGATETERIVRERIGQAKFRAALLDYWQGRCPLTNITEPALLRASHIVPWAHCRSDFERLDVHNGLLLAAHWDAAFDAGLVSFDNGGRVLIRAGLSADALAALRPEAAPELILTARHREQLAWHRIHFGFS